MYAHRHTHICAQATMRITRSHARTIRWHSPYLTLTPYAPAHLPPSPPSSSHPGCLSHHQHRPGMRPVGADRDAGVWGHYHVFKRFRRSLRAEVDKDRRILDLWAGLSIPEDKDGALPLCIRRRRWGIWPSVLQTTFSDDAYAFSLLLCLS